MTDKNITKNRDAAHGRAGRNRTLRLSKLIAIEVVVATLAIGFHFVELKNVLKNSAAKWARKMLLTAAVLPTLALSMMAQ